MTSPFTYDVTSAAWTLGEGLAQLHGLSPDDVVSTDVLADRIHPQDRAEMLGRFEDHLLHPGAYSCSYRMTDAQGQTRRLRFVGNSIAAGGRVFRLEGFVLDLGDDISRWQAEAVNASAAHRASIEQAKGVLMLAFGVEPDHAFRMLVGYSQHRNIKLRDVAGYITAATSHARSLTPTQRLQSLLQLLGHLGPDQGQPLTRIVPADSRDDVPEQLPEIPSALPLGLGVDESPKVTSQAP